MSKKKALFSDGDLVGKGVLSSIYRSSTSKLMITVATAVIAFSAYGCDTKKEPDSTENVGGKTSVADDQVTNPDAEFLKPPDKEFYTPYEMEGGVVGVYVPSGGLVCYVPFGDGTYFTSYKGKVTPTEAGRAKLETDLNIR